MDIKTLAVILVIGHLVSSGFIGVVIKRQFELFKITIDPGIVVFRKILFCISIAIMAGNLYPIFIDIATILSKVHRSTNHVNMVGLIYTLSNMLTAIMSAILVWALYLFAARTLKIRDDLDE